MKEKSHAVFIDRKINRITYLDMRFNECDDAKGEYVPGATTILNAAPKDASFYEWLKKYGSATDTVVAEAMEKGSKVHNATELYDKGISVNCLSDTDSPLYSSEEWNMIHKYVEFSEKYRPEVLYNESAYALKSLGYGGTLDRVVSMQGETWLLDIKTGNMYEYYWFQLAAYKYLFEAWQMFEWGEVRTPIDRIGIIHLNAKTRGEDKTGKEIQGQGWCIEIPDNWTKVKNPIDYYYKLFCSVKDVWNWQNPTMKPKNKIFTLTVQKQLQEAL